MAQMWWPWLALIGLGIYHGVNPAMGWLFAVALGLHRRSRTVIAISLLPIAAGHGLALATIALLAISTGLVIDRSVLRIAIGILLIAWSLWHFLYGARHRLRVGMQTGYFGLLAWSFLMAMGHGAGLMVLPVLMPLCLPAMPVPSSGALWHPTLLALMAVGIHMAAMLLLIGTIAFLVYDWIGVDFLRTGWVNLDLLWSIALLGTGILVALV